MSDREGTPESRESGAVSPSRSRSFSGSPSRKSIKSEEGSIHSAPENGEKSAQNSRSRSRSPRPRSYSRSRSRSYGRKNRSRTRSRSRERKRYRSRSRSRSRSRKRYSRSRSRSPYSSRRSSRHSRSSRGDRSRHRSHSRSPMSRRRRHMGSRDNPRESRCLGVFGLSLYTEERDIRDVFERYGPLEEVQVVYDHQTGRSRGFSFVYFRNNEDAAVAKERCTGIEIDGRRIRVDFSITERAHTPTPGIYLGKSTGGGSRDGEGSRDRRHSWRRSPSPYHRRGGGGGGGGGRYSRSRSRSRSYSPRRY